MSCILAEDIHIFDICFFQLVGLLLTNSSYSPLFLFFHIQAQLDPLVSQEVIWTKTTFSQAEEQSSQLDAQAGKRQKPTPPSPQQAATTGFRWRIPSVRPSR